MKKRFITAGLLLSFFMSYAQKAPVDSKKSVSEAAPAQAQPEQKTFLLIGKEADFKLLQAIIMQSRLSLNGQPLTAAEALQLVQWIEAKKEVPEAPAPAKK